MQVTQTRSNILRILKKAIDRAFAREHARCKRLVLTDPKMWKNADCGADLDAMFSHLSALPPGVKEISQINEDGIRQLLRVIVNFCYSGDDHRKRAERALLGELREHAAEYELLSHMPPAKREYRRRGKRTLVERRADGVDEKVREWERKLKYAETKLAAYRKKQKYYTQKKGAVV